MTADTRTYLEDVVKTIETRFKHRGWTTGKKKWEQRLLEGARRLLKEEQTDMAFDADLVAGAGPSREVST